MFIETENFQVFFDSQVLLCKEKMHGSSKLFGLTSLLLKWKSMERSGIYYIHPGMYGFFRDTSSGLRYRIMEKESGEGFVFIVE